MSFQKAVRERVYIKLAITGPTGAGKTYSALRLAGGLGKRIAFIDSENGSGSLYADKFDYAVLDLTPPFVHRKWLDAISEAVAGGFDVVIIDSLSQAWIGPGGLLDQKDAIDRQGGNSFANWGKITPLQNELLETVLHSRIHVIACMRSKMEYRLEEDSRGKSTPKRIGLAPQQREGIEYEFTTVFDIDQQSHQAAVTKDRTGLFEGFRATITEREGEQIAAWLKSAPLISVKVDTNTGEVAEPAKPAQHWSEKQGNGRAASTQAAVNRASPEVRNSVAAQDMRSPADVARAGYFAALHEKFPALRGAENDDLRRACEGFWMRKTAPVKPGQKEKWDARKWDALREAMLQCPEAEALQGGRDLLDIATATQVEALPLDVGPDPFAEAEDLKYEGLAH